MKEEHIFFAIFSLIIILAFTIGIKENFYSSLSPELGNIMGGDKLNPIFWLPAPIVLKNHSYRIDFEYDWYSEFYKVSFVSFLYWLIITKILSSIIIRIDEKIREGRSKFKKKSQ